MNSAVGCSWIGCSHSFWEKYWTQHHLIHFSNDSVPAGLVNNTWRLWALWGDSCGLLLHLTRLFRLCVVLLLLSANTSSSLGGFSGHASSCRLPHEHCLLIVSSPFPASATVMSINLKLVLSIEFIIALFGCLPFSGHRMGHHWSCLSELSLTFQ